MKSTKNSTYVIAFCSMISALGTVIMLAGGIIPVLTYCSPIISGVLLIAVCEETGNKSAWMVWAVTGMLSLMIGIDKEAAFFYLFIGWYPILKPKFDLLMPKTLRFAVKGIVFAGCLMAMYALTCYILGIEEIVNSFSAVKWINIVFFVSMIVCLGLYDRALNGMILLYRYKVRPHLKFLKK